MKISLGIALVTVLLLCTSLGAAQIGHFEIQTVRSGKYFSFPLLSRNANNLVTDRINRLLQLAELHSLAKGKSRKIFEQVRANDGSIYGGKTSVIATVHSNSAQVLSIGFANSSCGATCTWWTQYYTFNPGNGDRVGLIDLFTPTGFEEFSRRIVAKRSKKYRREVQRKVHPKFQESFLGPLGCFESDELSDYYIRGRTIVIDGENCLVKSEKFAGLDMVVRFRLSEFKKYLNEYGLAVFGSTNTPVAGFRSFELPQLFQGYIDGSIPIAMVINKDGEETLRGMYAYLKYGGGIGLKGRHTNSDVSLKEYVLSDEIESRATGEIQEYIENGTIAGRLVGVSLEGTWSSKDGSRSLPLVAGIW